MEILKYGKQVIKNDRWIKKCRNCKSKLVYEDNDILVCYKPAGIPTQTKQTMQMDVESELRNYLRESMGRALTPIPLWRSSSGRVR